MIICDSPYCWFWDSTKESNYFVKKNKDDDITKCRFFIEKSKKPKKIKFIEG